MSDLFNQGYSAFTDGMTEVQIKSYPPLFRAGWRAAAKEQDSKTAIITELRHYKVEKKDPDAKYVLQWNDLNTVLNRHPWNKLIKVQELNVIAFALRNLIWNKRDTITKFSEVVKIVSTVWDGLLITAAKDGVLDYHDLKAYNFDFRKAPEFAKVQIGD